MTKHSKNSTAHSVYSYHERQKDKNRDQNERFGRDSFKPFECCCLTLQPAEDPVVTPEGYLYDRKAILEYIVETKANIKRKVAQYNKRKLREEKQLKDAEEALKKEELDTFLSFSHVVPSRNNVAVEKSKLTSAECDYKPGGPCDFWSGPQGSHEGKLTSKDKPDEVVRCPMSNNPIKYKDLIPVNFCKYEKDEDKKSASNNLYCCAVSKDIIINSTQCVVLKTSGSIVTQEVFDRTIKKDMIDPINNMKIKDSDVIKLYRGSLGFTDERIILKIKKLNVSRIHINPESVQVLKTPQEFYQALLEKSRLSRKRIGISCLYVGVSEKTQEILQTIKLTQEQFNLRINFLFEGTRTKRKLSVTNRNIGDNLNKEISNESDSSLQFICYNSCREKLKEKKLSIALHTAPIVGMLPDRINEIFNVHHMKFYIFDDEVILSGANLNEDYFTSRQDRAWIIKNSELADFLENLLITISQGCETVGDFEDEGLSVSINEPKHNLSSVLKSFVESELNRDEKQPIGNSSNTSLSLTIQAKSYGIDHDEQFIMNLFDNIGVIETKDLIVSLSTGYFCIDENLSNVFLRLVSRGICKEFNVITSSMQSNGFLGSKGLSGNIPYFYQEYFKDFREKLDTFEPKVHNFYQWSDPNRTFHAKGLWITNPGKDWYISQIGSSNYNYRSFNRDIEAQMTLYTQDKNLIEKLEDEKNHIFNRIHAKPSGDNMMVESSWLFHYFLKVSKPILKRFF